VESERLFFDPNMLPQLYFPDEHKYAIYVPMFLPILVPILTGIFGEFRERRERGKKAAVTPTKKNY
jgi:phosphatidylinositol glycan class S